MAIPEKIGRYVIKSELGRGGMATVYRAFDPNFSREVALKVLPREMLHDPQFRARFEREVKMVAALEHPSIVPVYDVGEEDGQPYFVMRYMNGGSLSDLIAQGKIPIQDTARIVDKIARGLAYAHKKGVIHRDLKPDNILFDDNGEPFISDFGIAKLSEASGSLTGSGVIGTPAYMSPEQAQGGEIDGRSDVYGLGVIVYQMLSGQQPYSADTPMGVVVKHITEPVPEILNANPDLPAAVDEIIKTALAKDKTKRFENPVEFAKALNLLATGSAGDFTVHPTSIRRMGQRTGAMQLSRGMTSLVITGVVLLVLVTGFFLLRNQLFVPDQPAAIAEIPTEGLPALVTVPTNTDEPISQPPAPFCSADVEFPVPFYRLTQSICTQRRPYVNVSIPLDATFESLHPDGSCIEAARSGDRKTITCTGTPFLLLELKVCTPPVISNADLGKCSADATFNSENQCCVAVPPEDAGCIVEPIQLRGCQ
jgi:serine/threonine-protein kinase